MPTTASDYLQYGIYTGEGMAICFGNGLLLLAIVTEKSLRQRKEMLIIAGLCCADLLYGLGALTLNFYRIVLSLAGLENTSYTAWGCMLLPQVFLGKVGDIPTATMNFMVSVDRYIAIAFPTRYFAMTTTYAKTLLIVVFIVSLATIIVMYVSAYFYASNYATYTLLCVGATYPSWYSLFLNAYVFGSGVLIIFVYILVFSAYRKHLKQVGNPNQTRHAVNQRRLTVTLGLIAVSTTFFSIVPFAIFTYYHVIDSGVPYTIQLSIITRVSTIANIVIYVFRQKEVRPIMWNIFRCKFAKNTTATSVSVQQ